MKIKSKQTMGIYLTETRNHGKQIVFDEVASDSSFVFKRTGVRLKTSSYQVVSNVVHFTYPCFCTRLTFTDNIL